uniref:EF-hand domain-containing protein n=1 Tax=Alexandrium catenella TaxID=2925 RepID=A0A7S1RNA1_ALECA
MYLIFFILFVMMVVFGLLNVLTAVFVEATANIAHVDAELVIQDSLNSENLAIKQLTEMFMETDVDKSGTISKQQFGDKLEDPRFRAKMKMMGLDVFQAQEVFSLVDADRTDAVDIDDLVFGLMRLKGNARAMDIATMQQAFRVLNLKLSAFTKQTDSSFKDLRSAMSTIPNSAAADPLAKRVNTGAKDGMDPKLEDGTWHSRRLAPRGSKVMTPADAPLPAVDFLMPDDNTDGAMDGGTRAADRTAISEVLSLIAETRLCACAERSPRSGAPAGQAGPSKEQPSESSAGTSNEQPSSSSNTVEALPSHRCLV